MTTQLPHEKPPKNSVSRSRNRRTLFRCAALLLALIPFILLEIALVVAGVGEDDLGDDPFVGFSEVSPLFELDEDRDEYVISNRRLKFFAPDAFPAKKADQTFRVFVLGGSTVQGRPYSIETSFPTFARIALETSVPNRQWEVINCGGVSYASYRLVPILKECLQYEPDLIVVCSGHNEFLEDRSYAAIKSLPTWIQTPSDWFLKRRTVQLAANVFAGGNSPSTTLAADADAILDYRNGIEAFRRDFAHSRAVAKHYESNLNRMVSLTQQANVPLLFMLPPSNLSGQPPFKSEPMETITAEQLEEVKSLRESARDYYRTDLREAIRVWSEIALIDPHSADNWYEYGQCLEIAGQHTEARAAYVNARDLDVCPLRMTTPLEESMKKVSDEREVPLLNLHEQLEEQTTTHILGDQWLVDHVHPSFEGHYEIALILVEWMQDRGFVELPENWRETSRDEFTIHFESLDRPYFHRGQRALESLRNWTQGDRDGPPVRERFPHLFSKKESHN
ncbi:SGNH/GDSL hydrolase family protein [Thalassoglobus sp. JC818]|uniref:SGNH/GDSL hydrolase family protein n=1 Tax=Thalassoglobus sp. JC818 TaxID=3232136 RepID=UPI0034582BF2